MNNINNNEKGHHHSHKGMAMHEHQMGPIRRAWHP